MATNMNAATLAEVKRKASLGIGLQNATAEKTAAYNQTRSSVDKEIQRKAESGVALTNTNNAYNNQKYAEFSASRQKAGPGTIVTETPAIGTPATGTTTGTIATPKEETAGIAEPVDPEAYIKGLAEERRKQSFAALDRSRNSALSNLANERAAIAPKYYDQRNQTAAGSQQTARNFSEFLAARGGTNSGVGAQAEISRNMTLQGNLGSLGRQEAAAYTDIERRTSDVQNAYAADAAAAEAGIQGESMGLLLDGYYRDRDRGDTLEQNKTQNDLARAGLTGTLRTPEMQQWIEEGIKAKEEWDAATTPEARSAANAKAENARLQLGLLGVNPDLIGANVTLEQARANAPKIGAPTLAKQQLDWARDPNNPEVQRIRQDLEMGKIDIATAQNQLDELRDPNSVTNQLRSLGVEAARLGNEELRKRIAEIGKMPTLTPNEKRMQQLELEKAEIELDNLKTGGSGKVLTAKDMAPYFDDIVQRNENGQITNEDTVKNAIVNSDLSDYEAYQLYNRYGFTWDGEVPGK